MKTDVVGGPGAKKRIDPHKWEKREARLVLPYPDFGSRTLRTVEINVCQTCGLWCEERPDFIHDLPPCKESA